MIIINTDYNIILTFDKLHSPPHLPVVVLQVDRQGTGSAAHLQHSPECYISQAGCWSLSHW